MTSIEDFLNKKITLQVLKGLGSEETEEKTFSYAELALSTSIRMEGLVVKRASVTSNGGDNDGAMTLYCEVDGKEIAIRTVVLRKPDKTLYTPDDFIGKTIDVTGIVDYFGTTGEYQIKVFSAKNIEIHE